MARSKLVHIVDSVPALDDHVGPLVMVQVLDGFLDAGNASALAAQHLVDASTSAPVVATFDVDAFHDYRARRPPVTFARDHYEDYETPRLVVRLLRDTGGTPYLLLHGPEPDNRWEAFARAVRDVVERFGVDKVISLGSVPMAVPHTRPLTLTHHANNPELVTVESPWSGELRVPSSAQVLVELRLKDWGRDAQGFVAHIPHYLAQLDYPHASVALLEQVELAGRLTIDLTDLRAEADSRDAEITSYLEGNAEVAEVVHALERQYDAFQRSEDSGSNLLAPNQPLPTGEELGREFERFLAGLDDGPRRADDGPADDKPDESGEPGDGGDDSEGPAR
ncbi:proteasome assembly chaperone family protein [Nocardioides terrae]|uniref:proteasome assembly chaperone family protein n=1 Tax=Nocardioides terrae TaxID=574651 RepID=UPI000B8453B5|nr:PAC2 family protein [Nocardioides terrae]